MKICRVFFSLLAVLLAAGAIWIAFFCAGLPPVLLQAPEEASEKTEALMEAICSRDFDAAEKLLYGQPDLEVRRVSEDPVGNLLWDAYRNSLDYLLVGDCYATHSGLMQNVKIISMELPSATEHLRERAQTLLEQRIADARDVSEIYDAENNYRDTFVTEILLEAAAQALEEDVRYTYQIVPVRLVHSQGQWYVYPSDELLDAISGGMG